MRMGVRLRGGRRVEVRVFQGFGNAINFAVEAPELIKLNGL
jgi:hypothetical protein